MQMWVSWHVCNYPVIDIIIDIIAFVSLFMIAASLSSVFCRVFIFTNVPLKFDIFDILIKLKRLLKRHIESLIDFIVFCIVSCIN